MATQVKVCGLTRVADAVACVELGVHALGLNFWPGSVRRCEERVALDIVREVGGRARIVAVVVDAPREELLRLRRELGIDWIQLHGDEPASLVRELGPEAMKAVRVGSAADLPEARAFPGDELLVDARVAGAPGGTGVRCDWASAAVLARERRVWLAGGLKPDNLREAIEAVGPYGVDVASGVELRPGVKDLARVRAFVAASLG